MHKAIQFELFPCPVGVKPADLVVIESEAYKAYKAYKADRAAFAASRKARKVRLMIHFMGFRPLDENKTRYGACGVFVDGQPQLTA